MTSQSISAPTHWCRSCNTHHSLKQVQHWLPEPHKFCDETEVWICPLCNSYDVEPLQEVLDEK
ncbi:hypothetical protein C4K39_3186 [Pseudomonas sessilinigenes]|nr:hypothetical protein C4K39_3186 [Pseudomonas sessilinigenes]